MPFIAFDLDALHHVPDAARSAGISEEAMGYGLVRLWAWCWREKTDKVTAAHLRGFFGGADTGDALVAFGHLETQPEGYRVRGAEKYLRLSEQRQRAGVARSSSAGRSAGRFTSGGPAADQRPASGGPALTPSTQHLAPNTREEEAPPLPAPQNEVFQLAPPPPRQRPADPLASAEDFFAWVQAERAEAGLITERPPHPSRLSGWWSEALMELNGDAERLKAAFARYVKDPYWRDKQPRSPFGGFVAQWRNFAPARPA